MNATIINQFNASLPCVMTTQEFATLPSCVRVYKLDGGEIDLREFQGIYIYKNSKGINSYRRVKTIGSPLLKEPTQH